jgi:hypothetical protein
MKNILILLFITAALDCSAATGSASDAEIFVGIIIGVVLLIAASGYLIDMMKQKIKEARIRKMKSKCNSEEEDLLDSLIGTIPGVHA